MLGKSYTRNKTLTQTCTCVCVFSCVYEHIIAVFPHVLLLHKWFWCSSVHKGREEEDRGDAEGWLYNCSSTSEVLIIWIMQAFFFFLIVLLGERKWASLVNRSDCATELIICSRWLMLQDYKKLQVALVTRGAISHPELLTHFYVLQSQMSQ